MPVFFQGQGFANVMTADYRRKPAYYALLDTLNDARLGVVRTSPSAPAVPAP